MKKYSLSGRYQKVLCAVICIFLIVTDIIVFQAIPKTGIADIFILLSIVVIFSYFYVIYFSEITVDRQNHRIFIRIFRKQTLDLNDIESAIIRKPNDRGMYPLSIVISSQDQKTITLPTFFSEKQTASAEIIVRALNDALPSHHE
jgi:hypothetical protein